MHLTSTVEGRYMMYSNAFDCNTSGQAQQHLFTCRIFSNINKCQKFAGYLTAIRDRRGPWYGSQRHLQAWLGPMDSCCPSYLLLHSGVALDYPCGAPVWRVVDSCHAAWADEPFFARVSHTLFIYVFYVWIQTCLPTTSMCHLFRARDKPEKGQGCGGLGSSARALYCPVECENSTALPPWCTA
jgi:hypothetical protein